MAPESVLVSEASGGKEGYCEELEKGKNYAVYIITTVGFVVNMFLHYISQAPHAVLL